MRMNAMTSTRSSCCTVGSAMPLCRRRRPRGAWRRRRARASPGRCTAFRPTRQLATMTARFAPVDIGADVSALPDRERRALARLVDAAKLMDSLFLRQVWAGNDAMLEDLSREAIARSRAGARRKPTASAPPFTRLHYFLINKGPWSRLDHNRVFVPGAPAEARGRELLSRGRDQGGGAALDRLADRRREERARPASSRRFAAAAGRLHRRALQRRVSGRAGARRGAAARSRRADRAADAEEIPDDARRRVPHQRLLRERRRLDGARRVDRADDRPVRGLRGRVVQLQGRLRGLHHGARRRGDRRSCSRSRRTCRSSRTRCRSTRSTATRSSARSRRSASSTSSSPPATATAACRPRRSTSRTTSGS